MPTRIFTETLDMKRVEIRPMKLREFYGLPAFDEQRDEEDRADSERSKHLRVYQHIHDEVIVAYLRGDPTRRLVLINANTRRWLWLNNRVKGIPDEVLAFIWECASPEVMLGLYDMIDQRAAAKTASDELQGADRKAGRRRISPKMKKARTIQSLKVAYRIWTGKFGNTRLTPRDLHAMFLPQIDEADLIIGDDHDHFCSGVLAAFYISARIPTLRGPAKEFFEQYLAEAGEEVAGRHPPPRRFWYWIQAQKRGGEDGSLNMAAYALAMISGSMGNFNIDSWKYPAVIANLSTFRGDSS